MSYTPPLMTYFGEVGCSLVIPMNRAYSHPTTITSCFSAITMSTFNKRSTRRRTEDQVKRTTWGTWSPAQPQCTRALSLRLYQSRWGSDSYHSGNPRATVVTQIGSRVGRVRLTWISRCEFASCSLNTRCHPRATLRRDQGSRKNLGKRRKAGFAPSVIKRSAVRVMSGDMRTRRTGGRYTHALCAISFAAAKTRYRGTFGTNTNTNLQPHWNKQLSEGGIIINDTRDRNMGRSIRLRTSLLIT
ncbi:hypothetical protein H4582DRAFT_816038 [Lactarius indigo]|nr:hypothetical protein H4582DRAFT_816038 [Lactarius indigo]